MSAKIMHIVESVNSSGRPQRKAQFNYLFAKEDTVQIKSQLPVFYFQFTPSSVSLVINNYTPPWALTKGYKTTHQRVGKMITSSIPDISLFKSAQNYYMKSLGN